VAVCYIEITNMQGVIMHKIPAKLRNTPQEKYCFIKEQIIRDCYSDLSFFFLIVALL
jgi:hypothetical protein